MIKYLHGVHGIHLDALLSRGIGLIQSFIVAVSSISLEQPPVLHDFDCGIVRDVGRATLCPIVHDGYLCVRSIFVLHGNGRINWVVVSWNARLVCLKLVSFAFVQLPLLHLKPV